MTCKTARCECREAARVCVKCLCLEKCVNRAPQTRREETLINGSTEGKGTGKRKRIRGKTKEGKPA